MNARPNNPIPKGNYGRVTNLEDIQGWRERFSKELEKSGMSLREVSQRTLKPDGTPMSHTTVMSAAHGHGSVMLHTIAAMCDAINADLFYVITGRFGVAAKQPPGVDIPRIPRVTVAPVLPLSRANEAKKLSEDSGQWLGVICLQEGVSDVIVLRVEDGSMEPTYSRTSDVLVRPGEDFDDGDVVVALIDSASECILRRARKTKTRITLAADNEIFGELTANANRIKIIGKVVGYLPANG